MDELAFPQPSHGATGMTLRDYFAAAALSAAYFRLAQILKQDFMTAQWEPDDLMAVEKLVALDAYSMADAMMRARNGG